MIVPVILGARAITPMVGIVHKIQMEVGTGMNTNQSLIFKKTIGKILFLPFLNVFSIKKLNLKIV